MTTSLIKQPHTDTGVWSTMPGWGIVGDLTPPEIVAERKLRVLRRIIGVALAFVLVLCAAAYLMALKKGSDAQDEKDAAAAQTAPLVTAEQKYSSVQQIRSTVDGIRAQVAGALATDVNVPTFVARVRAALPATMAIDNLTLTLTTGGATTSSAGLDQSGAMQIGTVTISGSGRSIKDLPAFVDALNRIPGIVNVVPTSNQINTGVADFSLTFGVTDAAYSHHYDAHAGSK